MRSRIRCGVAALLILGTAEASPAGSPITVGQRVAPAEAVRLERIDHAAWNSLLQKMEHEILRKMNEPRIHFAIVCASMGCPPLRSEAYVADKIDQQLTASAQAFFSSESNLRLDAARNTIYISKILDWFGEDFGKNSAEQMRRLAPLLPEAARPLASSGNARIRHLTYDWDLNDQARSARQASQ